MRRIFVALLAAGILLCGCSVGQVSISPASLSQQQQEMLSILKENDEEILVFDFEFNSDVRELEAWMEIYQDGRMIESLESCEIGFGSSPTDKGGRMIVRVNRGYYPSASLRMLLGDAEGSNQSEFYIPDEYLENFKGCSFLADKVNLEENKGVILYMAAYSNDENLALYSMDSLQNDPELLLEYDYSLVVKFRFKKGE